MRLAWVAERVENPAGPGMPDVYYTLRHNGRMGWIELKHLHEWPKKDSTVVLIKHFTAQQRAFFKRHGELGANIYLLLQVDHQYFLLDWYVALMIGEMTKGDIEQRAKGSWTKNIDYGQFLKLL